MAAAIEISDLRHRYGQREALRGVTLTIERGEIFALLGPNGGGKTTLFKILCTLMRPGEGGVRVLGHDLRREAERVRPRLGVVFQNPGLDPKLTVAENLVHHGHLYGLGGAALRKRVTAVLADLDLEHRADDLVETLSGGLARRTELARGLLHSPELLLLDEPSTGLDPGARRDFAQLLRTLRDRDGVTVVLTTHHMEEAERADRVAVLHEGSLVALGTPDELKRSVGGDVVVIEAEAPQDLRDKVRARFGLEAQLVDGTLRLERSRGHELVRDIVEAFPGEVRSVTFGRPTLEDVFVHVTGRRFWEANGEAQA
ncbi:MAG TPA: ABC transporter ATP-binding protein [Candidatus Binatia bacterium]|nr:ABC transporter ATP-binding protein [Candidatus Binatia bacterium]